MMGPVVGVGMDLVEVDRMRAAVGRTPGLVDRVFTTAEADWAAGARDPAERLAVRFAAKEAVLKAMGVGLGAAPMRSIEVVRAPSGQPSVVLHGQAGALAEQLGVHSWHLSLTHTSVTAGAVAVAVGWPASGSVPVPVPESGSGPGPGSGPRRNDSGSGAEAAGANGAGGANSGTGANGATDG
jgi:holo-[acyl-carrier protein] synthase